MSVTVTPTNARDRAIASIKEAYQLTGQTGREPEGREEPATRDETDHLSVVRVLEQAKMSANARLMFWSLAGLAALACVVVAVPAWRPNHGQIPPELISTASISAETKPPTRTTANGANPATDLAQAQASPQSTPAAAPISPELARQIQDLTHQLANIDQGIAQLKTEQSRMAADNAELGAQLRATREAVRHNVELNEQLKATQAQTVQQISSLTDQLKANQGLIAAVADQLKQNQEQLARVTAAAEQKQRPAYKPSPKPLAPQTGMRKPDQGRPQPKQP
jgi:hypothetical protein